MWGSVVISHLPIRTWPVLLKKKKTAAKNKPNEAQRTSPKVRAPLEEPNGFLVNLYLSKKEKKKAKRAEPKPPIWRPPNARKKIKV